MSTTDFTWLIGGPQGSGVESGANIFSKVCAEMGYQIFGKREFYSISRVNTATLRLEFLMKIFTPMLML